VLLKGDCLVVLGRFDEAKEVYDLVRPDWDDFQAQTAYYNLGEIAFYEHDFEAALSYFNVAMGEYPGEELANDAVERLILIRGSRSGEAYAAELGAFADAALLERRGKPEEAVPLLRATGAAGPIELRTQSLKNLIRIYLTMYDYEKALEICKVAGDTVESHWSPVALETAADIYLLLGMPDEAVAAYEDVIVRYPDSVSAGEARRKLDSVRRRTAD
jgi:tetratricopeptide (TPR) repeat protein